MAFQDELIRDDTSILPTRHNILTLIDDLIDTANSPLRVMTYGQLKPAILAYLDARPDYTAGAAMRCRHHAAELYRLIAEIGDTSIHSERWIAHAGELRYAAREFFREEDLLEDQSNER